ncbi:ead/Ea22-like family protein [Klebsiella pneumoniae]|uniref:ead/Ea22-like family protein n=1 Tax=Klebsiella pneumoniae TaxID=573 RepID=UPI000E2A4A6C|nr:ead/Ea22-like family protein [Klebsiella pneumoniae]SYR60520.1 Ead domain protein [Klebsiella pneumoniae]HBS6771502.1 ead/Ea22-like family protein [Klebsiella pneumoniae]HBY5154965.1 ead/Ea22-like family protein [Klebsiella pneumoniae]
MTDITELAQSLKAAAEKAIGANERLSVYKNDEIIDISQHEGEQIDIDIADINLFLGEANPANILTLVEALEKAQQRNAELEAQNDYFASLVAMARVSADKAIRKFPQPNYVLLKVAEEAGEVVQAGVHYAENRMEWGQVEGEIVQLLAMLIRLVTEGDQVNGITPPALCSAGIKVEAE